MPWCCVEFDKHSEKTEDGFCIARSFFVTPHRTNFVRLCYEIAGETRTSVRINFCPWCGHDLSRVGNKSEPSAE